MHQLANYSDEELVELVRTSNKELYGELVQRYQKKLLRYARYLVNDEQKALDVVQEAFIKAYSNLNGFDSKRSFSSWIYRIVHNQAMNQFQKLQEKFSLPLQDYFASGQNVEEEAIKKDQLAELESCLQQTPNKYKEPLLLFYIENKSYEEISDIMRIPISTVGTRIARGKQVVQAVCQKQRRTQNQ